MYASLLVTMVWVPGVVAGSAVTLGEPGRICGKLLDFEQATVAGDGARLPLDDLHAVVFGRIVAGSDHDAAVDPVFGTAEHGVINFFGAAEPDIDNIDSLGQQTMGYAVGDEWAGQAHITANDHFFDPAMLGKCQGNAKGKLFVEIFRDFTPDVIGGKTA